MKVVRTCYPAPNMNAFSERWVRSIKSECLAKMIFFGTASLERSIRNFVEHYHTERPHQSLGKAGSSRWLPRPAALRLIAPRTPRPSAVGSI